MNPLGQANDKFLVVDRGNTLIKVAFFIESEIRWIKCFPTFTSIEVSQLDLNQDEMIPGIISSVSSEPESITSLLPFVRWRILDHKTPIPVINNYETPDTLGKDRLAGVVAASYLFPGKNVLVIDAGTAITYDLITGTKEYIGGSIVPGLGIRFRGLHTFTSMLPLYEASSYSELTGKDTYGSIMSGVMTGTRLEMDGFIREYEAKYPGLITVLTGGDAIYFDKMLKSNIFASPNLVLIGLKLILQYNFEK